MANDKVARIVAGLLDDYYTEAPDNLELVEAIANFHYSRSNITVEILDRIPDGQKSSGTLKAILCDEIKPNHFKEESARMATIHDKYTAYLTETNS